MGSTVNVTLPDAKPEILNQYRLLIPLGKVTLRAPEWKRALDFVESGGTLVINS